MKIVLRLFKVLFFALALLVIAMYIFGYDYLIKAVKVTYLNGHTTAFLKDYNYFDNQLIQKGSQTQPWPKSAAYKRELSTELDELHKKYETVSFLIIKNDSLWREKYYDGYTENSKSNSFSMAKTLVVSMLQKAIQQGHIKSLEQPVADYYPEFNTNLGKNMTVGDLASMSSGLNWDEAYYSPFSITTRAYFDDDLAKIILGLEVVETPGTSFKYLSGNTQLLAMVIEKATGQSIANYLSRNFWQPMGAENIALWQLDSEENGLVKAYCCIAASARDFARFGKLYKDQGKWNGEQLLHTEFIKKATQPKFENGSMYGYGLWLLNYKNKDFFMLRGHLGQYVIVQPEDNLIITRLGKQTAKKNKDAFTEDIYQYIDETYKMLDHAL
ncbi:serine hydrolase [Galbibacter sp. BG1]|uniref:serine hydrolase domain-containing protein n=1 Tax=Galbibacter sp. BG1 TaxID=1170699 RepID=UPI0015BE1CE7|nr:serine hydrolase [Galbibacter sp. BG1]QLE01232.1 serine hydrolase [Galbibacter sp. BG1]